MNHGIGSRRVGAAPSQFPISRFPRRWTRVIRFPEEITRGRAYFRDFAVRIALIGPGTIVPEDRAILYPPRGLPVYRVMRSSAREWFPSAKYDSAITWPAITRFPLPRRNIRAPINRAQLNAMPIKPRLFSLFFKYRPRPPRKNFVIRLC